MGDFKTPISEISKLIQPEKQKADHSYYGTVIDKVIENVNGQDVVTGYKVTLGGDENVVTCRRLAGAEIGDTVMVLLMTNGAMVVTGRKDGDGDAITAIDTAEKTYKQTFSDTTYTYFDGRIEHDVFREDGEEGEEPYYYYRNIDGSITIVDESMLERDADGNLLAQQSLSSQLTEYKNLTDDELKSIQDDLEAKVSASDVDQRFMESETLNSVRFGRIDTQLQETLAEIDRAKEASDKYQNYIQFTENNGLKVGYKENKQSVNIDGGGITFTNAKGNTSAAITDEEMVIPATRVTYLFMGPYVLEYMPSNNSLTLKER